MKKKKITIETRDNFTKEILRQANIISKPIIAAAKKSVGQVVNKLNKTIDERSEDYSNNNFDSKTYFNKNVNKIAAIPKKIQTHGSHSLAKWANTGGLNETGEYVFQELIKKLPDEANEVQIHDLFKQALMQEQDVEKIKKIIGEERFKQYFVEIFKDE
jgi:hypothetical protein